MKTLGVVAKKLSQAYKYWTEYGMFYYPNRANEAQRVALQFNSPVTNHTRYVVHGTLRLSDSPTLPDGPFVSADQGHPVVRNEIIPTSKMKRAPLGCTTICSRVGCSQMALTRLTRLSSSRRDLEGFVEYL